MARRYLYLLASLFVIALGVAIVTKTALGTSPIASVPYVMSLCTPVTMGQYMMAVNLLLIVAECILMTRAEIREQRLQLALQIPAGLLFGMFIDLSFPLIAWFEPATYIYSLAALLVGCAVIGIGVAMEVQAGVTMMATDAILRVVSKFIHKEFGTLKMCFDISLVTAAAIISFIAMGRVEGVREGTVIAAICVGPIVRLSRRWLQPVDRWFEGGTVIVKDVAQTAATALPRVITITREYCSGGPELGQALSKRLGIPFYDKELIAGAAAKSHLTERFVEDNEQSLTKRNLFELIFADYNVPLEMSLNSSDILFVSQSRTIRELAAQGPCIILGRCADFVLSDRPHDSVVRIFCSTDPEDAVKRCREKYSVATDDIEAHIASHNEARIHHYQFYTHRRWGDPHNYSLMINTAATGIEGAVELIAAMYRMEVRN